jgi:hypothetical protein
VSKRRRPAAGRRLAEQRFWGPAAVGGEPGSGQPDPAAPAASTLSIRPTTDPAAVVRSLGPPPLALDSSVVERHLTAVYEEAVRAATALAAANGLLADSDAEETGSGSGS